MDLFDYLKALTERNEDLDFNDEDIKRGYQSYMINRFVSMSEIYIPIVNEINQYQIPKNVHYRYMFSILPKRKQFFKYIKSKKDKFHKHKRLIAKHFEVGLKEADEYINILNEEELNEIIELYRVGKNKIVDV